MFTSAKAQETWYILEKETPDGERTYWYEGKFKKHPRPQRLSSVYTSRYHRKWMRALRKDSNQSIAVEYLKIFYQEHNSNISRLDKLSLIKYTYIKKGEARKVICQLHKTSGY